MKEGLSYSYGERFTRQEPDRKIRASAGSLELQEKMIALLRENGPMLRSQIEGALRINGQKLFQIVFDATWRYPIYEGEENGRVYLGVL